MPKIEGYIFGYGSLAFSDDWAHKGARWGVLPGYRRTWEVAIDNMSPRYDHKHYLFGGTRARFAVATLGIYLDTKTELQGVFLPVTKEKIHLLDRRELLYRRIEVARKKNLPVWTYEPLPEMYATYRQNQGNVFLPESYLAACKRSFDWKSFLESTDPLLCPSLPLELWRASGRAGL